MINEIKSIKLSNLRAGLWLILTFAVCAGFASGQKTSTEFNVSDDIVNAKPILEWIAFSEKSKGSDGKTYMNLTFSIANWQAFPDAMFAAAPDLPACGRNENSAQTWLNIYDSATRKRIYGFCALTKSADMQSLSFNVGRREMPECIYITLRDRRNKKTLKSNSINFTNGDNSRCEQ